MQGYIKLHRQVLNTEIFGKEKATKRQAWYELLLLTNHKCGYINIKNGQQIKVCAGQCGYSKLALADMWGWSKDKVTRFLNVLEREKMIQQKKVYNHTVITILNWELYQNNTTNKTTNNTTNGKQTIQQTGINNNDNNDKNVNKISLSGNNKPNEAEREKLFNYFSKQPNINNARAYVNKIINNNEWKQTLKDIDAKQERVEQQKKNVSTYIPPWKKPDFVPATPEEVEEINKRFREKMRNRGK